MRCLNHLAFRHTPQIATLATFGLRVSTTPLIGKLGKPVSAQRMHRSLRIRIRMVAGVHNLPIAPTIRFEIPIVEIGSLGDARDTAGCESAMKWSMEM